MNSVAEDWLSCTLDVHFNVTSFEAVDDMLIDGAEPSLLAVTVAAPDNFSLLLPLIVTEATLADPLNLNLMPPQTFLNASLLLELTATIGKVLFPKLLEVYVCSDGITTLRL